MTTLNAEWSSSIVNMGRICAMSGYREMQFLLQTCGLSAMQTFESNRHADIDRTDILLVLRCTILGGNDSMRCVLDVMQNVGGGGQLKGRGVKRHPNRTYNSNQIFGR